MPQLVGRSFRSLLILAMLLSGGVCFGPSLIAQELSEYQVKAAFLYNFAKFVEWPADSFPSVHHPITICVVGEDPFGADLDHLVEGKTVNQRAVVIKRLAELPGTKACQIAFVSSSERKHFRHILSSLGPAAVLTVGEAEDFGRSGGIITFRLEDGRVRFEINMPAAQNARLKISSKLLSVAAAVREGSNGS